MAKGGQIPFADAIAGIELAKKWAGGKSIKWRPQGQNGFPHSHKSRITLSVNGVIQEGYFVDLYHKISALDGVPDKVAFVLIVNGARVLALDENGPSDHMNTVGIGRPHFQEMPDHPHLHVPVEESTSGYAEPLRRVCIEDLWRLFLKRANISLAPSFNFPAENGQMELL